MALCNALKAELTYCVMYSGWRGEAFTWTWRSPLAWPRWRGAPEKVFSRLSDELMWRRLCLSLQWLMVARKEWTEMLLLFVLLIFTKSLWYPPLVGPVTGDPKEVFKKNRCFHLTAVCSHTEMHVLFRCIRPSPSTQKPMSGEDYSTHKAVLSLHAGLYATTTLTCF